MNEADTAQVTSGYIYEGSSTDLGEENLGRMKNLEVKRLNVCVGESKRSKFF